MSPTPNQANERVTESERFVERDVEAGRALAFRVVDADRRALLRKEQPSRSSTDRRQHCARPELRDRRRDGARAGERGDAEPADHEPADESVASVRKTVHKPRNGAPSAFDNVADE